MSAESDVKATETSIELTVGKITKLRAFITERRIHHLAETAVKVMHFGVETYWNKHYNLRGGQTKQLALFQGGGAFTAQWADRKYKGQKVLEPSPNSHNFRSRNGNKRLVSFTFGKPTISKDFEASNIDIHSFPMNLYERDVRLGGWAFGTIRTGTHIIRRLLPPKAQTELNATREVMLREINRRWEEMGESTG